MASFFQGSKYADAEFWRDTFDRAIATAAQVFVVGSAVDSAGIAAVDWHTQLSLTAGGALAAIMTSIAFRGGARGSSTPTD